MTAKQKGFMAKGRSFLAAAGVTAAGILSVTWGAIQFGETKIIRPYVRGVISVEFDSLHAPYSAQLRGSCKDIRLVREMLELSIDDSIRRRAIKNVREESVWATK